jgi:hypothetical protein
MAKKATLKQERASFRQAQKLLALFEDVPPDRLQAIIALGLLTNVRDADLDAIDPEEHRRICGLKPLGRKKARANGGSAERVIDFDADPACPEGWQVAEHRKGGRLEWSPDKARLFLAEGQDGGSVAGHVLRTAVAGENPFNANLLDWLLAHPEEIPESWKEKAVFFWGTVYRGRDGGLYVRYLYWDGGRWRWHHDWLGNRWFAGSPALVPVS